MESNMKFKDAVWKLYNEYNNTGMEHLIMDLCEHPDHRINIRYILANYDNRRSYYEQGIKSITEHLADISRNQRSILDLLIRNKTNDSG